jgi:hypothetical protein
MNPALSSNAPLLAAVNGVSRLLAMAAALMVGTGKHL